MMALTGRPDGLPLGAPTALVEGAWDVANEIARHSTQLGKEVLVDPLVVMAERAGFTGQRRGGQVSCGGASRLMRSADGWIAATMARASDWELLPALFESGETTSEGDWPSFVAHVATLSGDELRDRGALLGLALAVLGERQPLGGTLDPAWTRPGIRRAKIRAATQSPPASELVAVDISALWAGPLVGRLLADTGVRVIKVESVTRPDGARSGNPGFFSAMNGRKESVTVDLPSDQGIRQLAEVISAADVVITASRPRALEQLGLDPTEIVRAQRPRVWLQISGYGRDAEWSNRIAFGDDAAVAGGLVSWDRSTGVEPAPCFCGDAIADPLCGLAGTAAVLSALRSDAAWVIDASLADIAAGMAGPDFSVDGLSASGGALR
jgi:CoA-transferase family III